MQELRAAYEQARNAALGESDLRERYRLLRVLGELLQDWQKEVGADKDAITDEIAEVSGYTVRQMADHLSTSPAEAGRRMKRGRERREHDGSGAVGRS